MKLLILNANTSGDVTGRMVRALEAVCPKNVQLVPVTAGFGHPYVSDRPGAVIAGHAALEAVRAAVKREAADGRTPFDGAFYACFGEPGIDALRADNAFPVAGMAEASIMTALQLGERFSIVTAGEAWTGMLRDLMRRAGLDARFAGFGIVNADALSLARGAGDGLPLVEAAIAEALSAHRSDVVIVGGASLAGYGVALAPRFGVPVLDGLSVAFEQALVLARIHRRRRA